MRLTRDGRLKLRDYREARGLSLDQGAKQIGISRQALHYIERGMTKPRPDTLHKLANGYGIPIEELVGHPVASL